MPQNAQEKVALEHLTDGIFRNKLTTHTKELFYQERDMDSLHNFFPKLFTFLKC